MKGIIQQLPDAIANQIAAGEVVQRPASVVKELLENSIDAGADHIQLIIKDAGKSLIQIIDNGKGMSEVDARMCFERHATSKLKTSADLFKILTYGFRGEAMASIAAVAQVELKTKQPEDELGIKILIEGSEVKKQEQIAQNSGTSISVKNLFFNVPARRNFLKSNPVETRHIIEEFQRVALAYPEIGFSLTQNDLELYHLTSGKLSQRIVNIYGNSYKTQLVAVDEATDLVTIRGYIGKPESAKKTRGEQLFFVNNRFIKHAYFNHAITEAYSGMLPDKSYPFYCIFLTIDPKHVDINVHPTKTEVKFDDERTLYAIIHAAAKQSLGIHNITPSIDFEQNINLGVETTGKRDYGNEKAPFEIPAIKQNSPRERSNQANWEQLYQGFDQSSMGSEGGDTLQDLIVPSKMNQEDTPLDQAKRGKTFQVSGCFIAAKVKSGLMIMNFEAAHERILYEKYLSYQDNTSAPSQQSLFPQTIELNQADFALIMDLQHELSQLGFSIEVFGSSAIIINGVPANFTSGEEKALFEEFLEQFKHFRDELNIAKHEKVARALAKRTGLKAGRQLADEEQETLINELFSCKNPNYSPDGQATFVVLNNEDLNKFLSR